MVVDYTNLTGNILTIGSYTIPAYGEIVFKDASDPLLDAQVGFTLSKRIDGVETRDLSIVRWKDSAGSALIKPDGTESSGGGGGSAVPTEYYSVVYIAPTPTASASVVIGAAIPNAPAGIVWTQNQLILATTGSNRGGIYSVNADGSKTLLRFPGVGANGESTFNRKVYYPYGTSYEYTVTSGGINAVNQPFTNNSTAGLVHVIGTTANPLNTMVDNGLSPFTSAKTVYPNCTHTSIPGSVVLGDPIPGTVGDTFQSGGGTIILSTSFAGTMGDTYRINSSGVPVLDSAMPDNSYRVAVCNPTKGDSGWNSFGGTIIIRRSGSTREMCYFIPGPDLMKTSAPVNGYEYLSTAIGDLSALQTTNKSVAGAINEVRTPPWSLITGKPTIWTPEVLTYTVGGTFNGGNPDNVTIGAQIPGAIGATPWTAGQTYINMVTGAVFTLQSDGSWTSVAMPDNSAKLYSIRYGVGTNVYVGPGMYLTTKTSGTAVTSIQSVISGTNISVPYNGNNWRSLSELLGDVYPDSSFSSAIGNAAIKALWSRTKRASGAISGGTLTVDAGFGDYIQVAPTANITAWDFVNISSYGANGAWTVRIEFTQNSTPITVAYPSSFKWAGGTPIAVSTTAGAKDLFELTTFNGGTTWYVKLTKAYA